MRKRNSVVLLAVALQIAGAGRGLFAAETDNWTYRFVLTLPKHLRRGIDAILFPKLKLGKRRAIVLKRVRSAPPLDSGRMGASDLFHFRP